MGKREKQMGLTVPKACARCAKAEGKSEMQLFSTGPVGSYTNHYGSSLETVKQYATMTFKVCEQCEKDLEKLKKKESLTRTILFVLISAICTVGFYMMLKDDAEIMIIAPVVGLFIMYELHTHFGVNEMRFSRKHLGNMKISYGKKKDDGGTLAFTFVNGEYQKLFDEANAVPVNEKG